MLLLYARASQLEPSSSWHLHKPQQGCNRVSHKCLPDGAELPLLMSLTLARHAYQQWQLLTYL